MVAMGDITCLFEVSVILFIAKHPRTVMFVVFHFSSVIIVNYTDHVGPCILLLLAGR